MPNPGPALPILDVNSLPEWARMIDEELSYAETETEPGGAKS